MDLYMSYYQKPAGMQWCPISWMCNHDKPTRSEKKLYTAHRGSMHTILRRTQITLFCLCKTHFHQFNIELPVELSAETVCNASTNAGLPNTRRSNQANDRTCHIENIEKLRNDHFRLDGDMKKKKATITTKWTSSDVSLVVC